LPVADVIRRRAIRVDSGYFGYSVVETAGFGRYDASDSLPRRPRTPPGGPWWSPRAAGRRGAVPVARRARRGQGEVAAASDSPPPQLYRSRHPGGVPPRPRGGRASRPAECVPPRRAGRRPRPPPLRGDLAAADGDHQPEEVAERPGRPLPLPRR